MFNFIMILGISTMIHGLCAMEPQPKKGSKARSLSLSVPELTFNKTTSSSSNDSPKKSPSRSLNPSPNDSPKNSPSSKDNIKISPKKSSKGDLKVNYPEIFALQLWAAVKEDDNEKVLNLIQPNMNICDQSSGKTLLIIAIKNKNEEIVKSLLKHENIDVNKADKLGHTPLHHAVLACNEVIIQSLLYDYRVNSFIRNSNSRIFPYQCTDHEFYSDKNALKEMFKVRLCLDMVVSDKVSFLQSLQEEDKDALNNVVVQIKTLIQLPSYATDEFIKNMILYRMAEAVNLTK